MVIEKINNTDILKNMFYFLDSYKFKNETINKLMFTLDNKDDPAITYRKYRKFRYINSTFIRISHNNYNFYMDLYSYDKKITEKIFKRLDEKYPLDFKSYNLILKKINHIYDKYDFFDKNLIAKLNHRWIDFIPNNRVISTTENFTRSLKLNHKSIWDNDSNILIRDKLTFVKIKIKSGNCIYVPSIEITLPISKNYKKKFIISASANYNFIFLKNKNGLKNIKNIDELMNNVDDSIIKNCYRGLQKKLGSNILNFEDFIKLDKLELLKYRKLSNILKY